MSPNIFLRTMSGLYSNFFRLSLQRPINPFLTICTFTPDDCFGCYNMDDVKISILDFWESHLSTSGHCFVLASHLAKKVAFFHQFGNVSAPPKRL